MLPALDMSNVPLRFFEHSHGARWMSVRERAVVIALLRRVKAETVIEIGVQEGHCACDMLRHLPIKRYIGIDLSPGSPHLPPILSQRDERPQDRVAFYVKDHPAFDLIIRQRGSLDLEADDLPMADAFIIDGDHSLEAVRHDTELATARTRRGGAILWHDYAWWDGNGVPEVLHNLPGRAIARIENTNLTVEFR